MKKGLLGAATISMVFALASTSALAGGHSGLKEAMKDPKKMEAFMDARLDHRTGLEGKEAELGQAVAAVVDDLEGKLNLENSGDEEFGRYKPGVTLKKSRRTPNDAFPPARPLAQISPWKTNPVQRQRHAQTAV